MLKIPKFWYKENDSFLWAVSLKPVGLIYGAITTHRANKQNGYKSKLPVICVGNITMGGTGKTPTALALAKILKDEFHKNVAFLTRGYGGSITEPTRILPTHQASECGDEPLLLAKTSPTYISPDRGRGAMLIENDNENNHENNHDNDNDNELKTDVIILDDGMQNPTLQKDITLVIIDGKFGLGNNRLFPAGPLRESLRSAQFRSSAFIIIGEDSSHTRDLICETIADPLILQAHIKPVVVDDDYKAVVVFAGIGMPDKVFATAKQAGYEIMHSLSYGDHYNYTQADLDHLVSMSKKYKAKLLTTSKDYARLPQEFIKEHKPLILEIELSFDEQNKAQLLNLIKPTIELTR